MAGKFQLYRDASGKFHFTLKAANGEIIASGETYNSKEAALDGIRSVRNNAPTATIEDMTKASR